MVETLKLHSVLFEITDCMGYGKDMGLVIAVCVFAALMILDYAHILSGNKRYLVMVIGFGLGCILSMYMAAVKVNFNDMAEVLRMVHILVEAMVFNIIITVSGHLLKIKILDPIAERNSQKEFYQFLMEEGIDADSPEAIRMQSVWKEKNLMKI